jgi:septal ring factor EnvC (AmiA/AmiB activator)
MNIIDIAKEIITVAGSLASLGIVALLAAMLATHGVRRTIATARRFVDIAVGRQSVESTLSYIETSDKLNEEVNELSKRYLELRSKTLALTEERDDCHRTIALMQRRVNALHLRIEQQDQRYRRLAAVVDTVKRHADDIEVITQELRRIVECAVCKGECRGHRPNSSDAEC